MRRLVPLLLLAVGCMPVQLSNEPRPGQARAVAVILEAFGAPGAKVPPIVWVESLDCDSEQGWWDGRDCVGGHAWFSRGEVYQLEVAWPAYARRITDSFTGAQVNLVHELAHSTFGPAMDDHPADVFGPGGLVERVSKWLRVEQGL